MLIQKLGDSYHVNLSAFIVGIVFARSAILIIAGQGILGALGPDAHLLNKVL